MVFYDKKPSIFEAVGNGSYRYHFNIQEVNELWQCDEVIVWAPINSNSITEAVISAKWPNNYEHKLVNEYNAAILGLYDEDTAKAAKERYKTFLKERTEIKNQIDADCERELLK